MSDEKFEVRNAVSRLTAMGDVSPALKPVVAVALGVVDAARAEIEKAETRAALAEGLVARVRPELDEITRRAEEAERRLAERDELDAAEDARKSRDAEAVSKAEERRKAWTPSPAQVAQIGEMAGQVERLARQADLAKRRTAETVVVLAKSIRDQAGRSVFHPAAREHGQWSVSDPDGAVVAVFEKRSDAAQAVAEMLAEEYAEQDAETAKAADQARWDETYHPGDTQHRSEPWRRKRPARVEQAPAPSGEIAPGVSKRRKKQARIM